VARKMGVTQDEALYNFLASRIIERIGDHAVRIANNGAHMHGRRFEKRTVRDIRMASAKALELFNSSVEAWFRKDPGLANANIASIRETSDLCDAATQTIITSRGEAALAASYIVESIRRTGHLSVDLDELVINDIVRRTDSPQG